MTSSDITTLKGTVQIVTSLSDRTLVVWHPSRMQCYPVNSVDDQDRAQLSTGHHVSLSREEVKLEHFALMTRLGEP